MRESQSPKPKRWDWLIRIIKFHGFTIGAEVGVHRGNTTYRILDACLNLKLYAVDQWKFIPREQPDWKEIGLAGASMDSAHRAFMRKVYKYPTRLEILYGDSVSMASKVPDEFLDFVFIDADHRYEAALADIKAWTPKVKEDGIVCGHDYHHPRFPGVTRAVDECFGEHVIDAEIDHVWSARKDDFLL